MAKANYQVTRPLLAIAIALTLRCVGRPAAHWQVAVMRERAALTPGFCRKGAQRHIRAPYSSGLPEWKV